MLTATTNPAPSRAPNRCLRTGALGAGATPPTTPPPCGYLYVTSSWPPPPPHRGGRAPGARIGTGAAPEPPKTPLGLLGLVVVAGGSRTARYWAVWAGGDILGGGYGDAVKNGVEHGPGYPSGSVTGPVALAAHMHFRGHAVRLLPDAAWPAAGHAP